MDKWKFDLVVKGLTEEQADKVLTKFVISIEELGGEVDDGGGFLPAEEASNEQKDS